MRNHLSFALDALQNTLMDIKEYVNFLKNCQLRGNFLEKYDREYVRHLKAKYRERLEYYHYCVSVYSRMN